MGIKRVHLVTRESDTSRVERLLAVSGSMVFRSFPKPAKKIKKKKHIRRERKTPLATLKRRADKLMSQYIIARDKKCVICGSTKQLNNGHLISRRCNSVRWDDVNCNCQCYPCNFLHTHRPERYTQWFIKEYGSLMYEDLVDRSRKLIKVNRAYLEDAIRFIQEKHIILDNTLDKP